MPVADVPPVIGGFHVLVPGHMAERLVHARDVRRVVDSRKTAQRANLAHPGCVATRIHVTAGTRLDRSFIGPAQLQRHRADAWRVCDDARRIEQRSWLAAIAEGLVAAAHLHDRAPVVVLVGMSGNEPLHVERVRLREAAGQAESDVGVVANCDHRRSGSGDPADVDTRPVELHLVQLLGRENPSSGPSNRIAWCVRGFADRDHVRAATWIGGRWSSPHPRGVRSSSRGRRGDDFGSVPLTICVPFSLAAGSGRCRTYAYERARAARSCFGYVLERRGTDRPCAGSCWSAP